MRYACIAQHVGEFKTRLMCRALGVSPSGFYAAHQRRPSHRAAQDQRLRLAIRTAHAASHQRYGAPKIHAELRAQGVRCAKKRVARLMRLDGLRGISPRRFRVTTQSRHPLPLATNQLDRQFSGLLADDDEGRSGRAACVILDGDRDAARVVAEHELTCPRGFELVPHGGASHRRLDLRGADPGQRERRDVPPLMELARHAVVAGDARAEGCGAVRRAAQRAAEIERDIDCTDDDVRNRRTLESESRHDQRAGPSAARAGREIDDERELASRDPDRALPATGRLPGRAGE